MTIQNCNNCNVRNCKLATQNNYPNMLNRPKRKVDRVGQCNKWEPIKRTVPLGAVVRGTFV